MGYTLYIEVGVPGVVTTPIHLQNVLLTFCKDGVEIIPKSTQYEENIVGRSIATKYVSAAEGQSFIAYFVGSVQRILQVFR